MGHADILRGSLFVPLDDGCLALSTLILILVVDKVKIFEVCVVCAHTKSSVH